MQRVWSKFWEVFLICLNLIPFSFLVVPSLGFQNTGQNGKKALLMPRSPSKLRRLRSKTAASIKQLKSHLVTFVKKAVNLWFFSLRPQTCCFRMQAMQPHTFFGGCGLLGWSLVLQTMTTTVRLRSADLLLSARPKFSRCASGRTTKWKALNYWPDFGVSVKSIWSCCRRNKVAISGWYWTRLMVIFLNDSAHCVWWLFFWTIAHNMFQFCVFIIFLFFRFSGASSQETSTRKTLILIITGDSYAFRARKVFNRDNFWISTNFAPTNQWENSAVWCVHR